MTSMVESESPEAESDDVFEAHEANAGIAISIDTDRHEARYIFLKFIMNRVL